MLKMTIDNEEVLSNNDISIKEEILSPSSTILNNVYPKSWEQDKDYTSRFYYPKDYSKLNIQNFSVEPEEAGTTIDINGNATLTDVDTTKESRVLSLKGQTSQNGTPTPSSPIPINVVSGDNEINICGKNLLPQDKYITSTTRNGITYTNNGDGTFNLSGTATANVSLPIIDVGNIELEVGQPYYLYSSVPYNSNNFNMSIVMSDNGTTKYLLVNNYYTPTATPTNVKLQLWVSSGQSIVSGANNIKLMLVKGNTAPTTYEPYIGNTYPVYLGTMELCKIGTYQDYIYKDNGSWYLHKEIGKVVLDGSESWFANATNQSNKYRYGINFEDITTNYKKPSSNADVALLISNYYIANTAGSAGTYGANQGISFNTSNALYIYDNTYNTSSTTSFTTWLSTHNIIVYYVLATPTNTLIEDTTLIEQLEALSS